MIKKYDSKLTIWIKDETKREIELRAKEVGEEAGPYARRLLIAALETVVSRIEFGKVSEALKNVNESQKDANRSLGDSLDAIELALKGFGDRQDKTVDALQNLARELRSFASNNKRERAI